ncbi:MAG: YbjN domain-containing protein [Candidatus Eremiobacterota bacterium]
MLGGLFNKTPGLAQHAAVVEKIIRGVGLDPNEHRMKSDEPGRFSWVLQRGSATIVVGISGDAKTGEGWFHLSAPLVFLPEENLLAFYRRLLDLNGEIMGVALAAKGDCISLCAERPLKGMDANEAEELLMRLSGYADGLDDLLNKEFGAPMWRPDR